MTELETAFWQASHRAEQQRQRTRRLVTGGLALGFVVSSLATGVALLKVREAELNNLRTQVQMAATLNAAGNDLEAK